MRFRINVFTRIIICMLCNHSFREVKMNVDILIFQWFFFLIHYNSFNNCNKNKENPEFPPHALPRGLVRLWQLSLLSKGEHASLHFEDLFFSCE